VVKYRSVRYIFYMVVKFVNLRFRTRINLVLVWYKIEKIPKGSLYRNTESINSSVYLLFVVPERICVTKLVLFVQLE
jgi:hypothetical protein